MCQVDFSLHVSQSILFTMTDKTSRFAKTPSLGTLTNRLLMVLIMALHSHNVLGAGARLRPAQLESIY